MMTNDDEQIISMLLCKRIVGKATEEECRILDAWCKQSKWNKEAYERLLDPKQMQIELSRTRLTDYHRPLEQMKHRLGIESKKMVSRRRAFIYSMVSVAASVILIFGGYMIYNHSFKNEIGTSQTAVAKEVITPGSTRATLTLDNGEKIELGSNTAQNKRIIAQSGKNGKTAMNSLQTPRGGEFKVTLEDGTEVWLNAETKLRYPENFDGNERRVEVIGEAYFKVAHDSNKPFYVVSGKQEVRVYGTEFNVHAYPDETDIYTSLVSGSIALRPIDNNGSELMLTPGHQAVFSKTNESAKVRTIDTEIVTSWRSGTFVFEGQNLEQIMKTLSRWYNFDYEFTDKTLARTEFMGSIPKYGKFSEVVDIFNRMGGICLRHNGHKVIVSTK
jgi:ferric-dicitrate binding protein FerR (iron transport regulator)